MVEQIYQKIVNVLLNRCTKIIQKTLRTRICGLGVLELYELARFRYIWKITKRLASVIFSWIDDLSLVSVCRL